MSGFWLVTIRDGKRIKERVIMPFTDRLSIWDGELWLNGNHKEKVRDVTIQWTKNPAAALDFLAKGGVRRS